MALILGSLSCVRGGHAVIHHCPKLITFTAQVLPRLALALAFAIGLASARPQFSDPLLDAPGARDEFHPATHLVVEVPAVPKLGFPKVY